MDSRKGGANGLLGGKEGWKVREIKERESKLMEGKEYDIRIGMY